MFQEVLEYCADQCGVEKSQLNGSVSTLFDYAIDTGLIVPETKVEAGKCARTYRLSEQYELQENEFDLIIYMYNEYQKKTRKEMGRITTEKLLVLFFKEVITKLLSEYKSNRADEEKPHNLFGITYARFGPVVSDCSMELGVSKDTYLTKRLFEDSRNAYKKLYKKDHRPYGDKPSEEKVYSIETGDEVYKHLPEDWKRKTRTFASNYAYFEELLDYYHVFESSDLIKTFDKFLVIAAIGEGKDEQLLSLAAELKIYQRVVGTKKNPEDIISAIDSVMDGMISGIWKYLCYKNEEYQRCYALVAKGVSKQRENKNWYAKVIDIWRGDVASLKKVKHSTSKDLVADIKSYLMILAKHCKQGKNDQEYTQQIRKFNDSIKFPEQCRELLNRHIDQLSIKLYENIDVLQQRNKNIEDKYIDDDKIECLFTKQIQGRNKNAALQQLVEKFMDEAACMLYEIASEWNYIIESASDKQHNISISYTDRNINYLNKIGETLEENNEVKERLCAIQYRERNFDRTIRRLRELVHEIDLLLFCINQYILQNNSRFLKINHFYVVRRDDENDIEIDEMVKMKTRERALNDYLGFKDRNDCVAFVKSQYSKPIVDMLYGFSGYTLLEYDCEKGANTIVKSGERCYSKRVKENVRKILEEYNGVIVKVTDRR